MSDSTEHNLPSANRPNYYRHQADVTQLEAPASLQDMIGYLFIRRPASMFGQYYIVRRNALIGKKESCHIQIDDPAVEDPHARIKAEPMAAGLNFVLYDFGSESGTYVNGEKISAPTVLVENDVIQIGAMTFIFKILI